MSKAIASQKIEVGINRVELGGVKNERERLRV
jgi:hypothetical protein